MEELILSKSKALFLSYGLKSVTLDDVAKLAGVSKKTIYRYFPDKKALVTAIVEALIECHKQRLKQCRAKAKDAVEEVLLQSGIPFTTWTSASPRFFNELEKFFPHAWEKLEHYKQEFLIPAITKNLEKGKKMGHYRSELDAVFMAAIRVNQWGTALQPHVGANRQTGVHKANNELTAFYLHGITTEKGKKLLYKYLKNKNENG